jgi:anhydro-N-acetylmuramic acid kinase
MIVVSVASGTSADGLDVAAVELAFAPDGELELALVASRTDPWPAELREQVLAVLPPAPASVESWCVLDQAVGQAAASAVVRLLADFGVRAELVVSPGQTAFHDVRDGRCLGTLQVGQPAWIAEATGLPVVSDLRARDVAAHGHGAPLASTLDGLWLAGPDGPRVALNLGGIANVTVVGDVGEPLLAWDTGPANCLLDVAAERATAGALLYDEDGRLARAGTVRSDLLAVLLRHPHFAAAPPVTTGRETFSAEYLRSTLATVDPVEPTDLLATLTELTAVSVADALAPYEVAEVVASGGGTRNPALMEALGRRLRGTPLVTSDARGLPAAAKEAVMWALLGFLTWHGLPGATSATGAAHQRILGRISPGADPLRLPTPVARAPRRMHVRTPVSERNT